VRTLIPLRTRPALWLIVPALLLVWLYSATQSSTSFVDGYWVGAASSASIYLVLAGPYAAVSAALDANRLRRHQSFASAPVRHPLAISWANAWPSLAGAMLVQAVGLLVTIHATWGAPGTIPWPLPVAWVSILLLHTAVGFALGLSVPVYIAAPVAVLASYVWLGYTWSVSYFPLRYLAGLAMSGCCAVYSELDMRAPAAATIFSLAATAAIVVAALAMRTLRRGPRLLTWTGSAAVIAIAATVGLTVAGPLGGYPVDDRKVSDLRCSVRDGETFCFYPEQLRATQDPASVLAPAVRTLRSAGVDLPSRITGNIGSNQQSELGVLYRPDFSRGDLLHSFSSALGDINATIACPQYQQDPTGLVNVSEALDYVIFSLATDGETDAYVTDPASIKLAQTVLAAHPDDRLAWIGDARETTQHCSASLPEPPLS
jgi:hypothetical protein